MDPRWHGGLEVAAPGAALALLRAASHYVDLFSPDWKLLLPEAAGRDGFVSVAEVQAAGFAVVPWTVNRPETMRRLLELGVDGMITDYPDRLLELLREAGVPIR